GYSAVLRADHLLCISDYPHNSEAEDLKTPHVSRQVGSNVPQLESVSTALYRAFAAFTQRQY
ncbi:MAG: hypothetical protein FWG22_00305, partial [Prolixibacteraceae bacterium]|nr:hypothetical protein [Prolixibacteraceae bacterium]